MHRNRYLALLGLLVCVFPLVSMPDCRANLIFDVTLNTSSLIGNPFKPFFYIDFQLNDGSGGPGDGNNTVKISNFEFSGGAPFGSPIQIGGASGNLGSSASITDSDFANEFIQPFVSGLTLSFHVDLMTNVDDDSPTPDAFSFRILDLTLTPLSTDGLGNALLLVNINSSLPRIETFSTTDGSAIQPSVPEAGSSFAMLLVGLGVIWCCHSYRRVD